jgi:hypothetical protein
VGVLLGVTDALIKLISNERNSVPFSQIILIVIATSQEAGEAPRWSLSRAHPLLGSMKLIHAGVRF